MPASICHQRRHIVRGTFRDAASVRVGGGCAGVGRGSGAVQRDTVGSPAGREHGPVVLYRQRGTLRHLLPHAQADHAHLRRPQPPRLRSHLRHYHLPQIPWTGLSHLISLFTDEPLSVCWPGVVIRDRGRQCNCFRPSVYTLDFWTKWPLTLTICMCMGRDDSSPGNEGIEGQGQRSRLGYGLDSKCSRWELHLTIKDSFLVVIALDLQFGGHG